MSERSLYWTARWCENRFLPCALLLAGAVAAFFVLSLPIWLWRHSVQGLFDAGYAALICLASGVAALGVTCRHIRLQQPLTGMLLAMACRLLPPLVVCLVISQRGAGADYFGFVCSLLLFYMITLAVETYLSVQLVQSNK